MKLDVNDLIKDMRRADQLQVNLHDFFVAPLSCYVGENRTAGIYYRSQRILEMPTIGMSMPPVWVYRLTPLGQQFEPLLVEIHSLLNEALAKTEIENGSQIDKDIADIRTKLGLDAG